MGLDILLTTAVCVAIENMRPTGKCHRTNLKTSAPNDHKDIQHHKVKTTPYICVTNFSKSHA